MAEPNPAQRLLGTRPRSGLDGQVAAIVMANRGKVNYRQLILLTGWDRHTLRRCVATCRAAGMIPPTTNRRRRT